MNNTKILFQSIINGWNSALQFTEKATGKIFDGIKPEYLVTVLIAQEILEKTCNDNSLIVKLEEKTKIAFENSFERCKVNNCKFTFSKKHDSKSRPGRFDIVLYESVESISSRYRDKATKYVIEVKNFEPKKDKIKKDIKRIKDLLMEYDEIGGNSFEKGYITFVGDYSKQYKQNNGNINEIFDLHNKRYNWISKHNKCKKVNIISYSWKLSEFEPTNEDNFQETHCFIGHIITIGRK